MTHPLTFGNGCTLEDCHTNVFALAELDGLSYKRLSPEKSIFLSRSDDPVLQSYNRCIQADILCAWKRTCNNGQSEPDLQLGKELWIFWYGMEPSTLSSLISPELRGQTDTNSYAKGMSYEARILLFKALHTLIERCLYSQNYILIGKWFVQAYDHFGNCNPEKSAHLSIQFSFFLHGESTVCANVDVKQHLPLCKLHHKYITYASQNNGITVLLAPYGLSAHFTGQYIRDSDPFSVKLLTEWRQYYVLNYPVDIKPCDRIASVVEVVIDGNAMYYPSCFVFVTGDVDEMIMKRSNDNLNKDELEIVPCNLKSKSQKLDLNHSAVSSLTEVVFSQVHTDSIVNKSASDAATWNITEPYTCASPCSCSKKGMVAPSANREHAKKVSTPTGPIFHHRSTIHKTRQCLQEFNDVLNEQSKSSKTDITLIDSIKLEDSPLSSQIASNDASSICTPVSNVIPPTSIPPATNSPPIQSVNPLSTNNVVVNEQSEYNKASIELVDIKYTRPEVLMKRPTLPFKKIHDDGEVKYTDYLYDFRSLDHWENENMRKRPLDLLSPKSMDDSKDEKIMKQSLDDLKDEVHIKPSCNVPDKLFETESDNSDTEMIPMIPLSPIDETDKGEPDLSEMYPTPPSMDHLHSPGSVTQNSPSNSEASYNESLEIYKNLKNEIHAHNESFRTQLEIDSVYSIPERAITIEAECYSTIDITRNTITTPVYTPKINTTSLNCYSMLPTPDTSSLQPPRSCPSPSALIHYQTVEQKNALRKHKNALSIIITLSDTILSIHKDRNFDSSVICSCNNNIDGSDSGIYMPRYVKEVQYKCTCGFSSVLNRTLGFNSGLFYEDEKMISGISYKQSIKAKLTENDYELNTQEKHSLLKLVIDQCTQIYDFNNSSKESATDILHKKLHKSNILQLKDASSVCYSALDMDEYPESPILKHSDNNNMRPCCLHSWIYRDVGCPVNTQDIFRLLKSLQPLLQEALQKKSSERLWEATYTITGPLSYKDFHLLSGRGSDETSEPQPIPPMILGLDRQWITVAPQSISYWDKLMLEPAGRQRDIVYIALVPDTELTLNCSRVFLKELSNTYELLRFGQHRPVNFDIRDSIIRIGAKDKVRPNEIIDPWFKNIGNTLIAEQLSLYAKVCQYTLTPVLLQILEDYDKLLKKQINKLPRPSGSTYVQNSLSQHCSEPVFIQHSQTARFYNDPVSDVLRAQKSEIRDAPSYLIYMINPFSLTNLNSKDARIAYIGLIKCFSLVLEGIPHRIHHKIHLQLVSLNTILEYEKLRSNIRMLAISIYSKCRRLVSHSILGQPVTSFGPAATLVSETKTADTNLTRADYKLLYCPPYALSIERNIDKTALLDALPAPNVLLVIYCLSDDQNWLLVTCTDSTGQIMESQAISIAVDNRDRRKEASARKIGLQKLWDFAVAVMSAAVLPWRLVIGRFGRIGHTELIGWAGILSRNHIQETCKRMSSMCRLCQQSRHCTHGMPYIQSACLVSLEPHPSLRIITDSIKVEEKQSGISSLNTPKDSSVTHILVFPTSALAQPPVDNANDSSEISDDIFKEFEDFENSELINSIGVDSPPMKSSRPPSPRQGSNGANNNPSQIIRPTVSSISAQDCDVNLLQQPLALGFYISTAKTGRLPDWFWSNCPERKNLSPVCLKSSLHIHCASAQETDDYQYTGKTQNTKTSAKHPLDSNTTCDVLRYVLEMYNALSWLTIDCQKNERNSCLPIHIVVLMQMYQAFEKYI